MKTTDLAPIVRSTVVRCPVEVAFEYYTARISEWWPLESHSVGDITPVLVTLEPAAGGRIFETSAGGETAWGRVLVWDPPARLVHTWHPGRPERQATEVEIAFAPHPEGTEVTVEHRNWHRLGAEAPDSYKNYTGDNAWTLILGLFKTRAEGGSKEER